MVHRIDTPSAIAELPATLPPGAPGFWQSGNSATGAVATNGNQDFFNMLQEEPIALLALAGVKPAKGNYGQMAAVIAALIQQGYGTFAAETGGSAINAYVVAPNPGMAAMPPNGTMLRVLIATGANTQAATLTCGFGPVNILRHDGSKLRFNDIVAGINELVSYDGAWRLPRSGRTRIGANLNLNIATAGNDANDGLTAATALATPQGAVNLLQSGYDLGGSYGATVAIADGGYANVAVSLGALLPGQASPSQLVFTGDAGVTLNGGAGENLFAATGSGCFSVMGAMSLIAPSALYAAYNGLIRFQGCNFGASSIAGALAASAGGNLIADGAYSISGGGPSFLFLEGGTFSLGSVAAGGVPVVTTGMPAFANGFAVVADGGRLIASSTVMTFSGSGATGPRFAVTNGGLIDTAGGVGANFPGNVAGTNDTTGIVR